MSDLPESARDGRIDRLAEQLRTYYCTAATFARWTPDWRWDAERILDAVDPPVSPSSQEAKPDAH